MNNEDPLMKKSKTQDVQSDDFIDESDVGDTNIEIENLSFDVDGDAYFSGNGDGTSEISKQSGDVESEMKNESLLHDSNNNSSIEDSDSSLLENGQDDSHRDIANRENSPNKTMPSDVDGEDVPSSEPIENNNNSSVPQEESDSSNNSEQDSKKSKKKDENKSGENSKDKKDINDRKNFSDKESNSDKNKPSRENNTDNFGNKSKDSKTSPNDSKVNNVNKPDGSRDKALNNQTPNTDKKSSSTPTRNQNLNHNTKKTPESPKANPGKSSRNVGRKHPTNINNAGDRLKKAGDTVKNVSKKVGKQVGKAAKKVGEEVVKGLAALSRHPVIFGIMIGVILFVIILCIVVPAFGSIFTPGQGNDIKEDFESFSVEDRKILEDINSKGYKPNAELALFAVAYPYFDSLQEGGLDAYLDKEEDILSEEDKSSFQQWYSERKNEILESFGCDELCQDFLGETGTEQIAKTYFKEYLESKILFWKNDCYGDDGLIGASCNDDSEQFSNEGESDRDPYLTIFKKNKMLIKYSKLLEKLNSNSTSGDYSSEEDFFKYLKSDYFNDDAGYKALFRQTDKDDELAQTIIDDIKANAGSFSVYIKDNCSDEYSFKSGGQITIDYTNKDDISLQDLLTKNIVVDVKKEGCTETGRLTSCQSLYSSPIPMEKYIIGVTVQEVGENLSVDKFAANMVAEKSFAIGRAYSRGNVKKIDDETYVIGIIDSTRDQAYCDYETLDYCSSGKSKLTDKQLSTLKEAWEKTQNSYLWNGKSLIGSVCQNRSWASACSCSVGKCLFQEEVSEGYENAEYDAILLDQFKNANASILNKDGNYLSINIGTSNRVCRSGGGNGLGIPDEEFIFYYQFNYKDIAFCGADTFEKSCNPGSDSICSSGCGVTSFAMLVSNLSSDTTFDPPKANKEAKNNGGCEVGGGSKNSLFTQISKEHSGFSYDSISMDLDGADKVTQVIRDGGLVAANVQKQSPFTGGGHWILIRGLTEDGKVKVADPNSKDRSLDGEYDIKDFINEKWFVDDRGTTHNWIAIYGPRSEEIKASNTIDIKSGDGVTTGYLKSPLNPDDTNEKARERVGSNSQTLYYKNRNNGGYHGAIDFPVPENSKIYAMDGGIVERSEKGNGYGNYIIIKHTANNKTYYTLYAHLNKREVKVGDKVSQGQEIGLSGNTGTSTGAHLHAELDSSISCLGHSCSGTHYNILKYIGLDKTYIGEKCDGKGC